MPRLRFQDSNSRAVGELRLSKQRTCVSVCIGPTPTQPDLLFLEELLYSGRHKACDSDRSKIQGHTRSCRKPEGLLILWKISLTKKKKSFYVYVLPACMHVHPWMPGWCLCSPEEGPRSPGTGVPLSTIWVLGTKLSLQEPSVPLAEPVLQPH